MPRAGRPALKQQSAVAHVHSLCCRSAAGGDAALLASGGDRLYDFVAPRTMTARSALDAGVATAHGSRSRSLKKQHRYSERRQEHSVSIYTFDLRLKLNPHRTFRAETPLSNVCIARCRDCCISS
jgi:hypothetical protein